MFGVWRSKPAHDTAGKKNFFQPNLRAGSLSESDVLDFGHMRVLSGASRNDEQARVVKVDDESPPFGTTRRWRERLPATNTVPQHVEP